MSGAGLSWFHLSPSRERRLWLFGAAAVSGCLALVLCAGAAANADPAVWAAAAATATAAGVALLAARRTTGAMCLAIDADGAIWLRRGEGPDDAPAERLQPRLAGDRLVTFSSAAGPVLVWRDGLPAAAFRRLSAHARWHVERTPRQPQATP
jgi:hypothetical protein